jgi:hypothetical protein
LLKGRELVNRIKDFVDSVEMRTPKFIKEVQKTKVMWKEWRKRAVYVLTIRMRAGILPLVSRRSSVVEQRFCKPSVVSSILTVGSVLADTSSTGVEASLHDAEDSPT